MERFLANVVKDEAPDGCWMWVAGTFNTGYGATHIDGRSETAHRAAWLLFRGPIPDGMLICHKCDAKYPRGDITYRRCVCPDHLFFGTDLDNQHDMIRKGRQNLVIPGGRSRKLDASSVIEIRRAFRAGEATARELAVRFSVHIRTIYGVLERRTWRHVLD